MTLYGIGKSFVKARSQNFIFGAENINLDVGLTFELGSQLYFSDTGQPNLDRSEIDRE